MLRCVAGFLFVLTFLVPSVRAADFPPEPASVQREGPAYRYPQAGWIVVHVEGEPYERGRQQGKLLWREIQGYVKCFATQQSSTAPAEGWAMMRTMTDALFIRRFDKELLEEMKGIADGAADAGAKFDGRPLDLTDIVAINAWPEVLTLGDALRAQPTGLEGRKFGLPANDAKSTMRVSRCSAFAATGPATRDGKAIIGHITMFDLYPCDFFNIWLDVKPARGHRLVLQGAPGSVQSGMDWYINDAGIVLTETTIGQTKYNPAGLSIGSRSRRAMQYGDSIDSVVKILGEDGNGLYTNEWLLADMHTNEIAMYELGTQTSRLMRSSKNEWFGGTAGFYWGNNNTKDLAVRLETLAATNDAPADMTFCPEPRDREWQALYQQFKGKMDADFARIAFGKPPLVTRNSCDAKFTTADMALQMKSYAHWGDPYGQLWEPSAEEKKRNPEMTPIVPSDWTVLGTDAPAAAKDGARVAVDFKNDDGGFGDDTDRNETAPEPVWHGTILPASDGDIWLTSAFTRFNDDVAREKQMLKGHSKEDKADDGKPGDTSDVLTQDERDELAVMLFSNRCSAMSEALPAIALRAVKSDPADDKWFRAASGRGVMLLSELRRKIGDETFDAAMDAFGRAHAGQTVNSDAFVAAMISANGSSGDLKDVFAKWLDSTDALPTLELSAVSSEKKDAAFVVNGRVLSHGGAAPANVDVTVETDDGETTTTVAFSAQSAEFHINSEKKPVRVAVNKYGQTPCTNGWVWNGAAYMRDLQHTVIVYGTRTDGAANHIAAEKLQKTIIERWEHLIVPIKADTAVSDEDLRGHHVLLIGRPECSELIERLSRGLPVEFGMRTFTVRGQLYANADSAVIAAGVNPLDGQYSIACVAGLGSSATLRAAKSLADYPPAPVRILSAHQGVKDIVPPSPGLTRELR